MRRRRRSAGRPGPQWKRMQPNCQDFLGSSCWQLDLLRAGDVPRSVFEVIIAALVSPRTTAYLLSMLNQRWRPVFFGGIALIAIWLVALVGYSIAKNSKVTPEKVRTYAASVDLNKLSGAARAKAIAKLAAMLNALSLEERRQARLEKMAGGWVEGITEIGKG